MNEEEKNRLIEFVKQFAPKVEKRFISEEDKNNLKGLLQAIGVNNLEELISKVFEVLSENTNFEQMPTVLELEASVYDTLALLKPATVESTPELENTFRKFVKVLFRVMAQGSLEKEELSALHEKISETMKMVADTEGNDPAEMMSVLNSFNLNPKTNTLSQEFKEVKFNILYETDKLRYLFNVGFSEVSAISEAIMNNSESVRIAGTSIKVCDLKDVKLITITDQKGFDNELLWSATMNKDIRKSMEIGKWSLAKLLTYGKDVTIKFLTPKITSHAIEEEPEIHNISLIDLLKSGEGSIIEFKSRFKGSKQDDPEKYIIKGIIQTIASFLNSQGGYLLIGVNDDGTICGLDEDFKVIAKENKEDGFKLEFDNQISKLGNQVVNLISLNFVEYENKKIALIKIKRKFSRPIYLNNGQDLFIRKNASSIKLNIQEAIEYVNSHWAK